MKVSIPRNEADEKSHLILNIYRANPILNIMKTSHDVGRNRRCSRISFRGWRTVSQELEAGVTKLQGARAHMSAGGLHNLSNSFCCLMATISKFSHQTCALETWTRVTYHSQALWHTLLDLPRYVEKKPEMLACGPLLNYI